MDIVSIINASIDQLSDGDTKIGLKAVARHIEIAIRHLLRGQHDQDDSAFNDVVYRCNQAFEGSLKEAYKLLAKKDPHSITVNKIEKYLSENSVFSDRVIAQFERYRKEWRNESTHDHVLEFNESEAFLAVMSVAAFVKLLVDEILTKAAFDNAVEHTIEYKHKASEESLSLSNDIATAIQIRMNKIAQEELPFQNEHSLFGAIAGHLSVLSNRLDVKIEKAIGGNFQYRADLVVTDGKDSTVVEFKRDSIAALDTGWAALSRYLAVMGLREGILVLYSPEAKHYELNRVSSNETDMVVFIISPKPIDSE